MTANNINPVATLQARETTGARIAPAPSGSVDVPAAEEALSNASRFQLAVRRASTAVGKRQDR